MLNIQLQPGDLQGDIVPQQNSPHISPGGQPSVELGMGNSWYSPGGSFRLTLQASDGNLVLQCVDDGTLPSWQQGEKLNPAVLKWVPVWSTKTNEKSVTEVDMQLDGNLVVYAGSTPVFSSKSNGLEHAFLRMQDDGNLVIFTANGTPAFTTNTSALQSSGNNT
jgi:hypothetical protein